MYAAFTLDRNGHPAGHVHYATEGVALCGKPVAEDICANGHHVEPELLVTCRVCKAAKAEAAEVSA